ncbi:MAG: tetratricopeptide repeat protein [Cyanobacteria bacterium J06614_10]
MPTSLIAIAIVSGITLFAIVTMVRAYRRPITEIPFPNSVIEATSLPLSDSARQQFVAAVGTFKAGDYRGALDRLAQVAESEPNCAEAFHNLGLAYANLGDNDKALRSLLKASAAYDQQGTKAGVERIKQDLERLKAFD